MSSEINVFFRGELPAKAALTRVMKDLGFPFSVAPPAGSLEKQNGFMPMRFQRQETGVEFDVFNGRAAIKDLAGDSFRDVDASFDRSANFRWGGDETEMLAGLCAAAALAKLVDGVVLNGSAGVLLSADEAVASARKHLDAVKPLERRTQVRLADMKHYLKPLLKQRSDLALVGRQLVVRPMRHLLRGAGFDRTGFGQFRIWSHVTPLYAPWAHTSGDYYDVASCAVWQPHFEPLLIDALAEDVFDKVGPVTTLNEFVTQPLEDTEFREAKAISLVLAGERDRAAEYVEMIKKDESIPDYIKIHVRKEWDRVSGDIKKVCAKFHAEEAATVKALKLEHIWEPSPFPVELPVAERATRSREPAFSTAPWITRPPWLWQEAPEQPGEIRFAKNRHYRNGRIILVAVLSPEEAERKHQAGEGYMLAVRLQDGMLLLIIRDGWDSTDAEKPEHGPDYRPQVSFQIELLAPIHAVNLSAHEDSENEDLIELNFIDVFREYRRESIWYYSADLEDGERSVSDYRTGEKVRSTVPLTSAELDLIKCPTPRFGEYAELVTRITSLLQYAGYGQLT